MTSILDWQLLHPRALDFLGFIPSFVSPDNPESAKDQLDNNYRHGGGWHAMPGWRFNVDSHTITYPGDPPLKPVASAKLRDEAIYVYQHAWVCIVQPDGKFEVARMD